MKKISRRSFVKAAGSAAVLSMLAACGGSSSSTAASTASTAASTAGASSAAAASFGPDTQAIVDSGVLKVGVKNAVQGFSFQDTALRVPQEPCSDPGRESQLPADQFWQDLRLIEGHRP